jgi:hypothetical protein
LTKAKSKRQTKEKLDRGKPLWGRLPWFAWLGIGLAIAAAIVFVRLGPPAQPASPAASQGLKAAIVDQLYSLQPNEDFITEVTGDLKDYGFEEVDVYQGDDITVDFYRNLPGYGYKLIVFRAHSGLMEVAEGVIPVTYLFTNEPYSSLKHVPEQLDEQLTMVQVADDYPVLFGIAPKFITQSMKGNFHNTLIIMMGCSCLYFDDLAQAFMEKGSSTYLAWDASVDLDYVDRATISLVKNLCSESLSVRKSVELTMDTEGPDPEYNAWLHYYPAQSADKTLEELISIGAAAPA